MKLYWKLFLRLIMINTVIAVLIWSTFAFVMIRQYRSNMLMRFKSELISHSGVVKRFLLWDDIPSIQNVLDHIVEENSLVTAAYLIDGDRSLAYTFDEGIPRGLMNFREKYSEHPCTDKFRDTEGNTFYDIAVGIEPEGADLHLLISRSEMDEVRRPMMLIIIFTGILMTVMGIPAAVMFSGWTEKEVKRLTASLEKRTSDLEKLNNELEGFSYSVSHDIRAPLRAIDGFSRILAEENRDSLSDEGKDSLGRILKGTERMDSLINSILKLSRIGRQEMNVEKVSLSDIVNASAELIRSDDSVDVEIIVQDGVFAEVDKELISVAIDNLLRNSVKFSGEKGKVEFSVQEKKGNVVYSICDNGVGFNMEYSHNLFKPFQKLHSEREFSGTGIGLSIVNKVISRHDGSIWAESEEGQGAEFFFTLWDEHNAGEV